MAVTAPNIQRRNPVATASAFGRFFMGVDSRLMFSQILTTAGDAGRCYQINDPVSEEISDLLDTDGGELELENCQSIQAIRTFKSGVLVFAANGVWYVFNPDGGFKATGFNIAKIGSEGITDVRSIVEAESVVYFFSDSGIVRIVADELDNLRTEDMTVQSIRGHYIQYFVGKNANGIYDRPNKQIHWWNPEANGRGLIYDLELQAFMPQQNASTNAISSPVRINNYTAFMSSYVDGGSIKYTLSGLEDDTFKDFGEDTTAYLVSGWETLGSPANKKRIRQAKFFFNKTETQITGFDGSNYTFDKPSACLFQSRFNFDNSDAYGYWVGRTTNAGGRGKKMNIYNPMRRGFIPDTIPYDFNTGEGVITSKRVLSGNGDAVQFYFEAQDEKDLQLLGYTVSYLINGDM